MKNKLFCLTLFLFAGFFISGCPSDTPKPEPTKGAKPSIHVDMPAVCGVQPILKEKYEAYLRDPIFGEVAKGFVEQVKKLEHDKSLLGETFIPYEPDPSAGYSKYYVVDEDPESASSGTDPFERELIPVSQPYLKNEKDIFSRLYTLKLTPPTPVELPAEDRTPPGTDIVEYVPPQWQPDKAKRIAGFVFAGYKIPPEKFKENCGHWSDLLNMDRNNPPQRKFETLFAENTKGELIEYPGFSVVDHIFNTTNSLFISTSRSIYVARRFAIGSGARRSVADEAWVYAILVHNAFDTRDENVKPILTGFEGEQEISVSGIIEWSDIVGYRKILREPKPGAPPEFVGPIYMRERLKSAEPKAFAEILRLLSMKSKYTQDFEQGKPWRDRFDTVGPGPLELELPPPPPPPSPAPASN